MWHQRLGAGRRTAMRDSSLIHPPFWINTFQSKNSEIFMCMLVMQSWSLQSFWPACSDSCASCGIQQDRCSSSLAKAPSETFFSKQSFPCFWKPRVCFPTLHKGVEPQFTGPSLNKNRLQLPHLSAFKSTSLLTLFHAFGLTAHICSLNYTQ